MNTIITSLREFAFHSQMLGAISEKIKKLSNELINQPLLNRDTREFSKNRDEFYRKLNEKFSILSNATILSQFNIQINIKTIEGKCLTSLDTKITEISSEVENFLTRFSQDQHLTRQDYDDFNLCYLHLISIKQEMTVVKSNKTTDVIRRTEQTVFDKIRTWENSIKSDSKVENIATNLMNMKRISTNMPSFKIKTDERIDQVLNDYKSRDGATGFARLGTILNQDRNGIGPSIISEHKSFQGYSLALFNERIQRHDINYVLNNLRGDSIDRGRLEKRYEKFDSIYKGIIERYLRDHSWKMSSENVIIFQKLSIVHNYLTVIDPFLH